MSKNLGNQASKNLDEATELMKRVAMHTSSSRDLKKTFSDAEIAEINQRKADKKAENEEQNGIDRLTYRRIKRRVKELEAGNNSRVIAFPSPGKGGWYKMIEFSALYYAYRLAERMGRGANVRRDNDAHSKALYSVSLTNIEKFIEQFKQLETHEIEICQDGVIIFTLKRPLSDDEVGQLRNVEETRRERMHNILKPKAMSPKTYQDMLMLVRQVLPRVRKLDRANYSVVGEYLVREISELMMVYFCFADGVIDKKTAGSRLIAAVNKILAEVSVLAEIRVWQYEVATSIGENVNNLKQTVMKEFKLKVDKE